MLASPTTSSAKLAAGKTNSRVRSSPLSPRPRNVSVSRFSDAVRLICNVPLANKKMPYSSSAEKFVSTVMTPQNSGLPLGVSPVAKKNLPAVAPTVPSLMMESSPLKSSEKTSRVLSISMRARAAISISGSSKRPALWSRMPPEISMKKDSDCVMMSVTCDDAVPWLASTHVSVSPASVTVRQSFHERSMKVRVSSPLLNEPPKL